jgi:hypothetical protein
LRKIKIASKEIIVSTERMTKIFWEGKKGWLVEL